MVQECYKYVDAVTDLPIKLRLIDTLRTVTAGKVCSGSSPPPGLWSNDGANALKRENYSQCFLFLPPLNVLPQPQNPRYFCLTCVFVPVCCCFYCCVMFGLLLSVDLCGD